MEGKHSKATLDVINAALALAERDIDLGLVTVEQISAIPRTRFAPVERKQIAEALKAQGMSNRQIAKVTGAAPKTIDRDLASDDAESASNDAPPEPKRKNGKAAPRGAARPANQYIRKLLAFMVDYSNEFRAWLPEAELSADDKEALIERLQSCAQDLVLLSQEVGR